MQKREQLLLIIILIAIFTISGCSFKYCKAYLGDELPKDQIAWVILLPAPHYANYVVSIRYVDGKPLKFYGCGGINPRPGVMLLPGKHTLRIELIHYGYRNPFYKDLSLEAEPNRFYMINYIIRDERELGGIWTTIFDAWINDRRPGLP